MAGQTAITARLQAMIASEETLFSAKSSTFDSRGDVSSDLRSAYALAGAGYGRAPSRLDRLLYTPAFLDWVLTAYFMAMSIGLYRGAPSATRDAYLLLTVGLLVTYLTAVYAFRLRFESRGSFGTLLAYHLLPVVAVLALYFNLRAMLPIINGAVYDDALYRIDLRLFGLEPTLAVEPYSTARVVEWFSFFYYSYFHFTASFVFVMIACCRDDRRLAIFATGLLLVVTIGHFGYTLVPGYGPYAYLAHEFQAPLEGGPFYGLVLDTVGKAGPLRDIFPSLHTAMPAYCTLFAWRHYPRVAAISTLFSVNIILATIVLRWHYAIDVVAGLILAVSAFMLAPRLVDFYQSRRAAVGLAHLRRW
jgi:membrane-associated phospholipid phosphatase